MESSIATLRSVEGRPVRGGRRRWSDELKAWIATETPPSGVTAGGVWRRYGNRENQLTNWRLTARDGRQVLLAEDGDAECAALTVQVDGNCVPKPLPPDIAVRTGGSQLIENPNRRVPMVSIMDIWGCRYRTPRTAAKRSRVPVLPRRRQGRYRSAVS